MPIPKSVTRAELREATRPLFDLLGVSEHNVYRGVLVGENITFTIPVLAAADPAGERAKAAKAWGREPSSDFPPHPHDPDAEVVIVGSDPEAADFGYEVTVEVED